MTNKQIASRVLDYWFAIEFLGQDSYEMCTDDRNIRREMHKFLNSSQTGKKSRKQIFYFEKLDSQDSIYDVVRNQADKCNMTTWGNLTFYIGKVKRQTCIERLAQKIGVKFEQVEKIRTRFLF